MNDTNNNVGMNDMNEIASQEQQSLDVLQQALAAAHSLQTIEAIADADHQRAPIMAHIGAASLGLSAVLGSTINSPVAAHAETVQLHANLQSYSSEGLLPVGHVRASNNTITVRAGDTLSEIAQEQGMTAEAVAKINQRHVTDPNIIYPGQQLLVSPKMCKPGEVLVAPDDSLSTIAEKLHTTVGNLVALNNKKITNRDLILVDECYDMTTQKKVSTAPTVSQPTIPVVSSGSTTTSKIEIDPVRVKTPPVTIAPTTTSTAVKSQTNTTIIIPKGASVSSIASAVSKNTGSPYPTTKEWIEKHNPYGEVIPEGKPIPVPVSPDVIEPIAKDMAKAVQVTPTPPVATKIEARPTNSTIIIPPGATIGAIAEAVAKNTGSPLPTTREWIVKHNPYGAVIPAGQPIPVPVSPDKVEPITKDVAHAAEAAPPVVVPQPSPETGHNNIDAIPAINGTPAETVKFIVKGLESTGITAKAAAWITGSIIQESSGNPTARGDYVNGTPTAFGYIQAHEPRSNGMPSDGLEQLKFIVNHDIPNEGQALNTYMRSSGNVSAEDLDKAIREWERFGVKGQRDDFARQIDNALNTPKNSGSANKPPVKTESSHNKDNSSKDNPPSRKGNQNTTPAVSWMFSEKKTEQFERVDEGWDVRSTPGSVIKAVAAGVIQVASADPGGFGNDYPIQVLDQNSVVGGWTDTLYYGHVHVDPNKVGKHVQAGEPIAVTNKFEGENGSAAPTGWIEIGMAKSGTGAPLQQGAGETEAGHKMKNILKDAPVISSQNND
ncbi:MAG: hypothetical protein NVSMB37_7910 [Candidatus Saccharimonadales bacterium]